jgi:hypothetical protein
MTPATTTLRLGLPGILTIAVIATAIAGCGDGSGAAPHRVPAARPASARLMPHGARSVPPPALAAGWHRLAMPSGGVLPYPPGWRPLAGDPGSVSAALTGPSGVIRGYLNATPADPDETPVGWSRFRIRHNADDGDRHIRVISVRRDVRLGVGGLASCVADQYATSRTSYRELACLFSPARGDRRTVLVAAAQPNAWTAEWPLLNLAFDHFTS